MTKIKNKDPFSEVVLDKEEELIEELLENGEFEESSDLEDTKTMLQEAAVRYTALQRSKPVTIRINQLDLIKVKAKAKLKQIPYQTLLGFLIHQYAEGEKKLQM